MSQISINTTQNVKINFAAASIGDRILSFLTDLLIQIAYLVVILYALSLLKINVIIENWDTWSKLAIMILFFAPVMFYTIVQESIFEGQTFGKRLLKIKVIKIDGYQASFGDYLIRWLFRLIDILSNSGIIGLISIVSTKSSQRLGDITAGTAVISLKNKITINNTILENIDNEYVPTYPAVIKLSDNDVRIIKENLQFAIKNYDYDIIDKLKLKVETVTGIKNQSGNNKDFLKVILKDYNFYTQKM
jgi:uncharacterized RDD family membrane protein YckC